MEIIGTVWFKKLKGYGIWKIIEKLWKFGKF